MNKVPNKDKDKVFDMLESFSNILDAERVRIREDLFVERHLPIIVKNGGPTKDLQIELIKLAGGETKVIDIVDADDKVVISLPSAIGNNNTISTKTPNLNRLNLDLIDAALILDPGLREVKLDNIINKNKKNIVENVKSNNPWGKVITHFKDEVSKIPVKQNIKKQKLTFDYD